MLRGLVAKAVVLGVGACSAGACTLVTDLDGLGGGASGGSSGALDAASDGGGPSDGGRGDGAGSDGARVDGASGCERARVVATACDSASYMPAATGGTVATRRSNPEVMVLGQHDSANGASTIVLDQRTEPHILVLASHDATRWVIRASTPTALRKVVLTGYAACTADVPEGVVVTDTTPSTAWAYAYPGADVNELFAQAKTHTGAAEVTAFAGCHDLAQFVLEDGCL